MRGVDAPPAQHRSEEPAVLLREPLTGVGPAWWIAEQECRPVAIRGDPAHVMADSLLDPAFGFLASLNHFDESGLVVGEGTHERFGVQRLLVREMVVEGADADAGVAANVLDSRRKHTVADEAACRRVDDPLPRRHEEQNIILAIPRYLR